jgi:integrase
MPRALSDAKARNAKPKARPYKLSDGEGLFLVVMPSGSKYWRLRYFFAGKEKLLALGVYPDISLADARDRRAQARKTVAAGKDPGEVKKEAKRLTTLRAVNSFEVVAREWLETRKHKWASSSSRQTTARLEQHVFPKMGQRPLAEINPPEVLAMLRTVEARGTLETAHRVMRICGQIFMYAIATGRAERNPVPDLRGALKSPVSKHYAFLNAGDLTEYLKKVDAYIPAERMKMKELHIVPLSTQAVSTLRDIQKHSGNREYVFPNYHNPARFMSENAMLYALYRMGYHSRATGHGFRSTASTILNENGFRADVIERQLAHGERNDVRAAYNHAQYLPERRTMMQWWADYLDELASKK